jgi:hypothetical protein
MSSLPDNSLLHRTLGRLVGAWMILCGLTTRWTRVDREIAENLWAAGKPVIVCFWHGRLMQAHIGWKPKEGAPETYMLISKSKDGAVIAAAAEMVGMRVVRGSTDRAGKDKGGREALRFMLRELKEGRSVAVTPDGPRGPSMRVQEGVIQLAKLSGAPIVCLGWSMRPRRVFKSWDSFVLPLPFARGVFMWGGPVRVARDADSAKTEDARLALEAELTRIVGECDRRLGFEPLSPTAPSRAAATADAA